MIRLLFVDDEHRILSGIENALIFADHDWEVEFANSGEEAVAMIRSTRYDVVVTDMKMPGLTGADVLESTRDLSPSSVRIILSGELDEALAERAMPLAHEFVSKPCDPDLLFSIIQRTYDSSRAMGRGQIRNAVIALDHLPSQPRIFQRIQEALGRGDGAAEVAEMFTGDVALASAVIRTANMAFYGFASPAATIRDAVVRLGLETVSGIVLNATLASWISPGTEHVVEAVNNHAGRTWQVVNALIGARSGPAPLAALLHDVGILVVASQFPEEFTTSGAIRASGGHLGLENETRLCGASHAEIGAYLLDLWKVDPVVVEATCNHHCAELAALDPDVAGIVAAMAAADVADDPGAEVPHDLDPALVERARQILGRTGPVAVDGGTS